MINHITTLLLPYIHKSISFLLQFCSYVYSFIVCIWLISDTGKFFSKKRNDTLKKMRNLQEGDCCMEHRFLQQQGRKWRKI